MSAPIYADPIQDGAADPAVIRNESTGEWWMFYTNRRARHPAADHSWIHGSPIGTATSIDGVSWKYRETVAGLDDPAHSGLNTHWAPEVIHAEGEYHMYLTYIRGAPPDWTQPHERRIVHLTSPDLVTWTRDKALNLNSTFVIDACVHRCPDGLYRLWYKDEADGSSTWVASSANLFDWTVEGKVLPGKPDGPPHEGPNVFELAGWHWLIVDEWHGQAVFRSKDAKSWERQGIILADPGSDPGDGKYARHADVVVRGNWAQLYYFTHPSWDERNEQVPLTPEARRTVIHTARLWVEDGILLCDRDAEPLALG